MTIKAPVGGLYVIRYSVRRVALSWRFVTRPAKAKARNHALFHASPTPLPSQLGRSLIKRQPTSDEPRRHRLRGNNARFNLHVLVADVEAASILSTATRKTNYRTVDVLFQATTGFTQFQGLN